MLLCRKGCVSPRTSIGSKPAAAGAAAKVSAPDLSVDFRGSLLGVVSAGTPITGLMMPGADAISLAAEHAPCAVHDSLADDATGARRVVSATDRCECSAKREGPIFRHVLSTIGAKAGKSITVEHGIGTGAAVLDGTKAVHVQTGDMVCCWPSIASVGEDHGL